MRTTNSLEKSLMLVKIEGRRRKGCQRVTDGITHAWTWTWANSGRCSGTGKPGVLQSTGLQRVRHDWATTYSSMEFSSVQSLSRVWLFATPWTAAHQASQAITNSWSLLKLISIKSVMPSNYLILCHPLLLLPSIFPRIRVFSNESVLHIRRPKYWSFSFSIIPSSEYSWLISFMIVCLISFQSLYTPCSME